LSGLTTRRLNGRLRTEDGGLRTEDRGLPICFHLVQADEPFRDQTTPEMEAEVARRWEAFRQAKKQRGGRRKRGRRKRGRRR